MSAGRVIIGGSTGFMGSYLLPRLLAEGREVVTISRSGTDIRWGEQVEIDRATDGAALVIGLAGKSVNCRYTPENRAEIFRSRLDTTAALSTAIARASNPPALWANFSTATIYRHAEDRPMTESTGEIGTVEDLARFGLGGSQYDGRWPVSAARRAAETGHFPGAHRGRQRFSWVHIEDVARIIDFLEQTPSLEGPVNAASPHPVENAEFMTTVRRVLGARIGVPMPRWMLELGAIGMRTETELILKSR